MILKGIKYEPAVGYSIFVGADLGFLESERIDLTPKISVYCEGGIIFRPAVYVKIFDSYELSGTLIFLGIDDTDLDLEAFDELRQEFEYFGRKYKRPNFRVI